MKNIITIILLLVVTTGVIMSLLNGSLQHLDDRASVESKQDISNVKKEAKTDNAPLPNSTQATRENLEKAVQDAINNDIRKAISDELSRHQQPTGLPQ